MCNRQTTGDVPWNWGLIWLPLFNWDALRARLINVTLEIPGRDLQPTKGRLKLSFQTSVFLLSKTDHLGFPP